MAPLMARDGVRLAAAEISESVASVFARVAVQKLPPEPAFRHADPVVQPRNRGEIEDGQHRVRPGAPSAQKADDARILVAEIHPLEPAVVEVELMQSRLASIQAVQIADPPP